MRQMNGNMMMGEVSRVMYFDGIDYKEAIKEGGRNSNSGKYNSVC